MLPRPDASSFFCLRRGFALCAGTTLFFGVSLAWADQEPKPYPACAHVPTVTDVAAAKGAFQAGSASFDEADYARAIVYWEDAYRRDCTAHALLLNLARAYELHGDKRQAVVALATYLERAPNSGERGKIERRIDVLQAQIDASPVPAATTAPAPPTPASPAPAPAPVAARVGSENTDPPEPGPRGPSMLPLIVAGAGGAIAIAGGISYAVAWSDYKDAQDACDGTTCDMDELEASGDDAKRRVNVSGVVTLGGLAIAGGGLVWYFVDRGQSRASTTGFIPIAAPGVWGLGYRGTL